MQEECNKRVYEADTAAAAPGGSGYVARSLAHLVRAFLAYRVFVLGQ
jgi:hypothetical protein